MYSISHSDEWFWNRGDELSVSGRLNNNSESAVVWKAWYRGTRLGSREMQAVCMEVVTSSNIAAQFFFGGANTLTLSEQQYFVGDTACQSKKWQDVVPLAMPIVTTKEWKITVLILLHVQSSTDKKLPVTADLRHKTASHCRPPMKRNIFSIRCYVYLLPTRFPANRDCLFKLCFAADASRWTQWPSSDYPSTRDSVQNQVRLNALWILTFIFTYTRQGSRGWVP